jgi:hypothetical protein
MLQDRLNRFPLEPFTGDGVPNTGGLLLGFVVNVNHLRLYRSLPVGSVAFTHTVYVVEYARPESLSVFVPFNIDFGIVAVLLLNCPLLHSIDQLKLLFSRSLIRMLQDRLNRFPVEPFAGEGVR